MTDLELLKQYAQTRSEQAFAELVGRHLDWVYWAAIRQVHDRQLAEDVAQAVFIALAQRAASLRRDEPLLAWMLRVTRCAAINALRGQRRRQRHEQKAAAMRPECIAADSEAQWEEVAPLLDEQVLRLGKKDKEAILLRFYERKSLAEVGEALGLSEEAAKKRVQRAVERLRGAMVGKGLTISAGALTVMVGTKVTLGAPAGLASSVVATAMAGGGAGMAGVIAKGAMKMMTMAKVKVIALIGISGLLAVGAILTPAVLGQKQGAAATLTVPKRGAATQATEVEFGAALSNGLRLEVVGVSFSPSAGQAWWKPDGSPLPDRPYDAMPNAIMSGGVASRDIAVRIAGQPADPATVKWSVEHQGGASGTLVAPRSPDIQGMAVAWPYEAKTTAVTFNVAAGPWKTVHVDRSAGQGGTSAASDANGASFIIHRPVEADGQAKITVVDNQGDFDIRIVAVDAQGGQHVARSSGSSAGVTRLSIAQFSDIAPSEITEIWVQTRPFDTTVRVDDISLCLGQTTQVKTDVQLPIPVRTVGGTTQPAASVEQLADEIINAIDATTTILKGVTDETTARAAIPKLEASQAALLRCHVATQQATPVSAEVQRDLAEHYGPTMLKSLAALSSEIARTRKDQAVYAILRDSLLKLQQTTGGN